MVGTIIVRKKGSGVRRIVVKKYIFQYKTMYDCPFCETAYQLNEVQVAKGAVICDCGRELLLRD